MARPSDFSRQRSGLAVALLVGLGLGGGLSATRAATPRTESRTISVVGHGTVAVPPDLAVLSVAVETTGTTAADATQANAETSRRVMDAMKKRLAVEDKLQTTGYSLHPQYAPPKPGSAAAPTITGYLARNEVRTEIHALDAVGRVLDAALQAGANQAGELSFDIADREPHYRVALAQAGASARAQAQSIAEALGVRLGSVTSASTSGPAAPAPRDRATFMRAEAASTPIEAGDLKVEATLYVTYAIVSAD